jgi:hypothetical protein
MEMELIPLGNCACGRKIYASKEPMAVAHELPYCKEFEELEPLEFVKFVRLSRGIGES